MNLKKSPRKFDGFERMKDFSNASFPPDTIKAMTMAMKSNDDGDEECALYTSASGQFRACSIGS
jgi:hypothetical protein